MRRLSQLEIPGGLIEKRRLGKKTRNRDRKTRKTLKNKNPDRKSRAGGKKVGPKVGQKIVKKTRIVVENHRFDHKNNVMLEREKTLQKKES